jgi:ribosomal protein S18 acetylase RimI-like enzyme
MVDIVPMGKDDQNSVRTLELFCIREYLEPSLKKGWEELSPELINMLGASCKGSFDHYVKGKFSYVAKDGDKVVGFLFGQMLHHVYNTENLIWVENMGVHPSYRRQGIAYRMLRKVSEDGKKKGASAVHSAIMPDNVRSIMLHKKLGFFVDARKVALLDLETFQ